MLYGGFALWSTELISRYISFKTLPVYDLGSSLFFWGWCGLLTYIFYHHRFRLSLMAALVVPLCSLLLILSQLTEPSRAYLNPNLKGIWFHLHVISMFLGIAMFLLASMAAIIYLWLDHLLKTKSLQRVQLKLPSLSRIDNVGHYSISLGFVFYTLGMLTGFIYSFTTFGRYWQWDPKEVWALVTWILYAVLLHERLALGWKGKKASIFTLLCFLALLVTFLGISHLDVGYHSFKSLSGVR